MRSYISIKYTTNIIYLLFFIVVIYNLNVIYILITHNLVSQLQINEYNIILRFCLPVEFLCGIALGGGDGGYTIQIIGKKQQYNIILYLLLYKIHTYIILIFVNNINTFRYYLV